MSATRVRARVSGTVQGVGFRPYVYRLAGELELGGWVLNDERGVVVEVEGEEGAVDAFLARLPAEAPPMARVEQVQAEPRPPRGERFFSIAPSAREGTPDALVAPDAATCDDCLRELADPVDRRFRYPFVNCTNCGPRFTIIRGVPYDRPRTTMAGFAMCPACHAEYEDPADRRFHAQPNACPVCGPRARLVDRAGREVPMPASEAGGELCELGSLATPADAVAATAAALRAGAIVAVKGLGGFHLACRADDPGAVDALRARKHREDKPFALMVADLAAARELVTLGPEEEELLSGVTRSIVLAPRRPEGTVAPSIAPGAPELGVMLPYTPLHHLLLADAGVPLVLTSANVSDEPIAYEDADALTRLAPIADLFLLHDRPIHMRTDDSVARVVRVGSVRRPLLLRRSRGLVPASLALPVPTVRPLLTCGAELKSTFCVARGERAWIGHHIGDLGNWETLRSFREGIAHFEELFAVRPEVVAHDLHPGYLSTAYAVERGEQDEEVELLGVQHHHAHLAAVLAEHSETGPAVGVIFDGTGYGTDGTVWGGELLIGELTGFERAGHLHPVRLPGGDRAVREPWRMACAWLVAADGEAPALRERVGAERWDVVARMAREGVAAPVTTSAGRLFDAVAALCGLRTDVTYEGQAAIELEAVADPEERGAYAMPLESTTPLLAGGPASPPASLVLDPRPAILAAVEDAASAVPPGAISARFHAGLAAATVAACAALAEERGLDLVVLSGGVFQNRLLLESVAAGVIDAGLRVLTPERLPPNDGGIAFGQAAIAAASGG